MLIKLKDNSSIELPEGSSAKDLADKLNLKGPHEALGANINGKTVDLSHPLKNGDQVILWNFEDSRRQRNFLAYFSSRACSSGFALLARR